MELLSVENAHLIKALSQGGTTDNSISLNDLIDLYTQIMLEKSDLMEESELQQFICKKINVYCDLSKNVQESSQIITGVKESTDTIITAIKVNNTEAIEAAYKELETYQARIQELEAEVHTDELTTLFNRRYLLSEKLEKGKTFKTEGTIYIVSIDAFKELNNQFGYVVGDSVLKYVALHLKKLLEQGNSEIIRFSGAVFIIFVNETSSALLSKKLKKFQDALSTHKFKTAKQEIIQFNFFFGEYTFRLGESFDDVIKKSMQTLS